MTDAALSERKSGPDLIRFIAIVFIICLHSCDIYFLDFNGKNWYVGQFYKTISRCGVQLFIILSGYLLFTKSDNILQFYYKRLRHVFIPFLFFSIIYYIDTRYPIYNNLLNIISFANKLIVNPDITLSMSDFIKKFFTESLRYHLWFMYPLIGLYLAFPFLAKMYKSLSQKDIYIFIFLFILISGCSNFIPALLWKTYYNIFGKFEAYLFYNFYGFAFLGIFFITFNANKKLCIFIYILSTILYLIETTTISISLNRGFEDSYNILTLLQAASLFLLLKDYKAKLPYIITDISRYAFGIYLVHLLVMPKVNMHLVVNSNYLNPFILVFLSIALTTFISYLIIKLLCKIPYAKYLLN